MNSFTHKRFKNLLKKLKHDKKKVIITYIQDNSLNLPPLIIEKKIRIKEIKMTEWKENCIYHYEINDDIEFDISSFAYEEKGKGYVRYVSCYGPEESVTLRILY